MKESNIDERINGYLDESLTKSEFDELAAWIRSDPEHAQRFARASMLHDRLANELPALELEDENKKIIPFRTKTWIAAAAAIVLTLTIWQLTSFNNVSESFVTISRADGPELDVGERKGAGTVAIDSGMIRMLFDSGVEVTLQGPAEFELVESDRMVLSSGILTAHVPPGAEGFRVDTPNAQITDLGTAFGVALDPDGGSRVSVFEGEVEVEEPNSGDRKLLTEGQGAVVTSESKLESVTFDPTPFEKIWPASSGISGSTGSFQLAPPWPRKVALMSSDEHIFVIPDGYRTELDTPLKVNASATACRKPPGGIATSARPKRISGFSFSITTSPSMLPRR